MKRILAGLALTTAAALVTATPAQAAPVDPVKALKKQFVSGHGVRISETTRVTVDGKTSTAGKTTGTFEFGKSGVVASDLKNRAPGGVSSSLAPPHIITVGGHSYAQGSLFSEELPEGKKWVRYSGVASGGTFNQILDIFDPKVLKTLVSHAKSFKSSTYKGSLTYSELSKAYGQKISGKIGKIKIDYSLIVNSKGLVTHLKSGWTMDFGILGKTRSTTESRYTGWGSKVKIKAPAEDLWIDVKDLGEDTEVPQEIPDNSINSLAN
ncbi:hypothetical protein [Nonomuraea zeae]|uniref:LppX_LprAFG lipoprotein n=1 Tax=Nonomuraea zeae TaxID=1642303 RepID=A0A5S4F4Y8_9ACTN|nr:hypothetical protein [Nonomuraea zeae]TMR11246.1 hypothetical protein ETD85_59555 [Nonomuraea zeae]